MWIDLVDEHVLVNTTRERVKAKLVEKDPRVSLSVRDEYQPLTMLAFQGGVVGISEDGAVEHIHALAKKYTGKDRFAGLTPGHTRMILKIPPERVVSRIL